MSKHMKSQSVQPSTAKTNSDPDVTMTTATDPCNPPTDSFVSQPQALPMSQSPPNASITTSTRSSSVISVPLALPLLSVAAA